MNLKHCKYYIEVVKCQSFSRASRQLDVNPATLAIAMNTLEDEVGCRLLYRTPYGVFPTEKGEEFYHDVSGVFHLQDMWKMQGLTGMPRHPVFEVGAVPAVCNSVMPDIALNAAEGNDPAVLTVREMQIGEIDDAILANRRWTYIRSVNPHEGERLRILTENMGFACEVLDESRCRVFMHPLDPARDREAITPDLFRSGGTCCTCSRFKEQALLKLYPENRTLFYNQHCLLEYLSRHCGTRALLMDILERSPWVESRRLITLPWSGPDITYAFWLIWPQEKSETADIIRSGWKSLELF